MDRRMTTLVGAVLLLALAPGARAQEAPGADTTAWSATVLPQTEEIAALATGVAVGPDAIVAVGRRACEWRNKKYADIGRCWGQPWISTDGVTWEAVEARSSGLDLGRFTSATSGPEVGVEGVASGPGGFVAYGWARSDRPGRETGWGITPTLWRSADGRSWERIPTPESFVGDYLMQLGPWLHAMTGSEEGYLLGGTIFATPAPRAGIWSSPDGLTWTLAEDDGTFDVGAYIDTMEVPATGGIVAITVPPGAADFSGAIAVGAACPARERVAGPRGGEWRKTYDWTTGDCWAQYWRSSDGLTWDAGRVTDGSGSSSGSYGADAVATTGASTVVGTTSGAVLFSGSDMAWSVAQERPLGRQLALAASDAGLHALVPRCQGDACRRKTLDLWSSANGAAWEMETTQPTMPTGVEDFIDVDGAAFGDRIVITAGYWTSPRSDPASMALLSPPLAAPGSAEGEVSPAPSPSSAPGTPEAALTTLPAPDAAGLPESVVPPPGTRIAWVDGANGETPAIHVAETVGAGRSRSARRGHDAELGAWWPTVRLRVRGHR